MSDEKDLLWEQVYKVARLSAARCTRIHRHLVTADDVFQHLNLWALEHWHKIEEWEGQDSLVFKLRRTFNNESQKFAARERAYKSKSIPSDAFYYTHEVLQELLKDVWRYDQWVESATPRGDEFISKSSKPSEGMNREAMLSDVSGALKRLNEQDNLLLQRRFDGGGTDFDALAIEYSVSEEALRKRVSRALTKLQDRLGGEQPQWNNRRYRKPDND
jgi:RNA polymerase sigma factor (sigma-70 family)